MVRQTLWASGFALSVATVWGFLESFDLVGHVDGLLCRRALVRRPGRRRLRQQADVGARGC